MVRKSIPEKIKKKIFQEANMCCPICGESEVTTFEIHHIQPFSESPDHSEENLILLCSNCHAKVTAQEISETEILRLKISLLSGTHKIPQKNQPQNIVTLSDSINSGVVANTVNIKTTKKTVKVNPPKGTIGASPNHRNYTKHLIDRYHEFKLADVGKENMKYTIIYSAIKKKFGSKWDFINIENFDKLVSLLHYRIDQTILGKVKKAKKIKRYSSFEEYLHKNSS
ncbi:HNH endonuclease signature motif containing protein [uncultured Desulfuromusa sp.]|uniref:HNH endonuclease n=1 Tax=uncultured Desulfuromusa sp. TaxID=219183 RepID=UPI002AA7ADF6|nr:HNH endonuclease signature motif containing protein [uncultured Desulfuromusa sp.]